MRRLVTLSFSLVFFFATVAVGAPADYLTEDELDTIRDAQELHLRLPAYFKLAEKRLVVLGVAEKSEKEKEAERKRLEQYEKEKKKAGDKADKVKEPVDEYEYLYDFTRSELLRGYVQIIDEIMTNLDDAYTRKLDVRDSLEKFEKFARETRPLIEKFQPRTEAETLSKTSALDKAGEALNGLKEALKIVPKTEIKSK
jgi:hypothetical protein